MALFLRLDNDKPFGNAGLLARTMSKVREELWFPALRQAGFMEHADSFFQLLEEHGIKAHWYFRMCTIPSHEFVQRLLRLGHAVGLHAEMTRSFESFNEEITEFKLATRLPHLHSFTKHGSGTLKLGRRHYARYEPDRYLEWAARVHVPFLFGNDDDAATLSRRAGQSSTYFPSAFWIEQSLQSIEWLIATALKRDIVVLIHPENYFSNREARCRFDRVVAFAKAAGVSWAICPTTMARSIAEQAV